MWCKQKPRPEISWVSTFNGSWYSWKTYLIKYNLLRFSLQASEWLSIDPGEQLHLIYNSTVDKSNWKIRNKKLRDVIWRSVLTFLLFQLGGEIKNAGISSFWRNLVSTATESIESFIEGQAFSAPRPPSPSPISPVSKLTLFLSLLCVTGPAYWRKRGLEGEGVEPNHTSARKPGPL